MSLNQLTIGFKITAAVNWVELRNRSRFAVRELESGALCDLLRERHGATDIGVGYYAKRPVVTDDASLGVPLLRPFLSGIRVPVRDSESLRNAAYELEETGFLARKADTNFSMGILVLPP